MAGWSRKQGQSGSSCGAEEKATWIAYNVSSVDVFFPQISRAWKAEDGEGRTSMTDMTVTMMCISCALVISWIVGNNCCMSFLATLQYSLNGKNVELFLVPSDILLSHVIIAALNWRYAEKPPDGVAPPKAYTCHAHQQKGACKIISWSLILGWFWSLNHFQSTLDSWQLQQLHPWNFTLTPNKNSVSQGFTIHRTPCANCHILVLYLLVSWISLCLDFLFTFRPPYLGLSVSLLVT